MVNWKKFFSERSLRRGRDYYREGRVLEICHDVQQNIYVARVQGTEDMPYRIELPGNLTSGKISYNEIRNGMHCTCPYAEGGNLCKHIAASLYRLEEMEITEETGLLEERFRPFREEEGEAGESCKGYREPYRYIDLDRLTGKLLIRKEDYEEALDMIRDKKLKGFAVRNSWDRFGENTSRKILTAELEGLFTLWQAPFYVVLNSKEILELNCAMPECRTVLRDDYGRSGGTRPICKHCIGLLILYREYLSKGGARQDATSAGGTRLLESFRTGKRLSHDKEGEEKGALVRDNISLKPILCYDHNGLSLEFRIGKGKMYKLKDIGQLVEKAEAGDRMTLGKNNTLDFRIDTFDEESGPMYDFIRELMEETRERRAYYQNQYYYGNEDKSELGKKSVPLFGRKLDAFFDLYAGKTVASELKASTGSGSVALVDGKYCLPLRISPVLGVEDRFEGVRIKGEGSELFDGVRYSYFFEDGRRFVRITEENRKAIKPFTADDNLREPIVVGRHHLSALYHDVLPRLEEYIRVDEVDADLIRTYLPPRPEFVFYLDTEQDEVLCRVECIYDEERFTLTCDAGGRPVIDGYRDRPAETEIFDTVTGIFPDYDAESRSFKCDNDADVVFNVLENGVRCLMLCGEVQSTEAFRSLKLKKKWKIGIGVSIRSDLLNLSLMSEDISVSELAEIMKSYKLKKKYHRLRNGDFISMEDENLAMLSEMLETLQLSPRDFIKSKGNVNVPMYRALYLDRMLEDHEEVSSQRDRTFKNLIRDFKTTKDADYEVPASLDKVLRKYQKHGFRWLMTMDSYGFGGILADEMGLGKTVQVISMLESRKERDGAKERKEQKRGVSLVVCPSSLVYNWVDEFEKFAPGLKVVPIVGAKPVRQEILNRVFQEEGGAVDAVVTSYDLLKRDVDLYTDLSFDYEILDEAQYIKNHQTAATKSVKVIRAAHRLALTGTPIENRLSELWSIFDFLMPGYLYGYEQFRRDFEVPIVGKTDDGQADRLRRMVSPFIMRRLKKDVLKDLPDKIEETRVSVLGDRQRELYDAQVMKLKDMLEGEDDAGVRKKKIQILAELTRLREICCDPGLVYDDYEELSAKVESLLELLRDAIDGGHRCLVFSQFTSMFSIIEPRLKEEGIEYMKIVGATPKEERAGLVKEFNRGQVPVFIISLKAGGTGLNLTGADTVIHFDPWWNVAVQNQATDRAHRIGQDKVVTVYKLICKGTIEEKIVKLQESKKELAEEILQGETGNLAGMTREELLALL